MLLLTAKAAPPGSLPPTRGLRQWWDHLDAAIDCGCKAVKGAEIDRAIATGAARLKAALDLLDEPEADLGEDGAASVAARCVLEELRWGCGGDIEESLEHYATQVSQGRRVATINVTGFEAAMAAWTTARLEQEDPLLGVVARGALGDNGIGMEMLEACFEEEANPEGGLNQARLQSWISAVLGLLREEDSQASPPSSEVPSIHDLCERLLFQRGTRSGLLGWEGMCMCVLSQEGLTSCRVAGGWLGGCT